MLHLQSSRSTRGSLSLNAIREICSYIQDPHFFAALSGERMEVYDLRGVRTDTLLLT